MKRIVIIPANSDPYVEELLEDTVEYETLSDGVGGMIEHVALDHSLDLWVNEEGKLLSLPINPIATMLWSKYFGNTDIIMGDALITGGTDEEGNTLGLSEEDADSFMAMLDSLGR